MKIKYIGSVDKVMLPGIPGTFVTGVVYEVSDKIGWRILDNPLFIRMDDELWMDEEFWLTDEKVDEPEEKVDEPEPWQLKVQEVETPIVETPEIEEVSEELVEEPVKRPRRKRTPKKPPKEIEVPEETLVDSPEEEKEKEKEVNTNGS